MRRARARWACRAETGRGARQRSACMALQLPPCAAPPFQPQLPLPPQTHREVRSGGVVPAVGPLVADPRHHLPLLPLLPRVCCLFSRGGRGGGGVSGAGRGGKRGAAAGQRLPGEPRAAARAPQPALPQLSNKRTVDEATHVALAHRHALLGGGGGAQLLRQGQGGRQQLRQSEASQAGGCLLQAPALVSTNHFPTAPCRQTTPPPPTAVLPADPPARSGRGGRSGPQRPRPGPLWGRPPWPPAHP